MDRRPGIAGPFCFSDWSLRIVVFFELRVALHTIAMRRLVTHRNAARKKQTLTPRTCAPHLRGSTVSRCQ